MKLVDLTLPTPAQNLALDEALLDWCESGSGEETLRFWESPEYFVVVGYANKVELEVDVSTCQKMKIPILRRCSGGGTVLQGPGCLNYNLVLRIDANPHLQTIPQTNAFVMERQRAAIQKALQQASSPAGPPVVCGHTDLAIGPLKFSGNAQRRKREYLVFHGTFLLNFDLPRIAQMLRMPSKEPDYRQNRSHQEFITNLGIASDVIKAAVADTWNVREPISTIPDPDKLVQEKYGRPEWNLKF